MHIGEAIIALMLGLSLAGYAYRDNLYRLDLRIIAKLGELPVAKKREYRGRHHYREFELHYRYDGHGQVILV